MGCRGYVGTTEVPNSMPGTRPAATAIRVSASNPELCGSHTDENPCSATERNRSTITSSGPYSLVGKNTPMFMCVPS